MSILTPEDFLAQHHALEPSERLRALVSVLRGPDGCPWDQRQTAKSMLDFVIDEAHELKEALATDDTEEIAAEFGDLAFTFTFLAETLSERVPLERAIDNVVKKMVARHPHVFEREPGQPKASEVEIKRRWESLKSEEPAKKPSRRMDRDIPASLGAWKRATKVLTRARNAGFRYPDAEAAWDKVAEEWGELCQALTEPDVPQRQAELGDLMLALATASIESGLDAEAALNASSRKLADRLERMEQLSGLPLTQIPSQQLPHWHDLAREAPERLCFNYCGVSPWPNPVKRAMTRACFKLGREGLAGTLALREERELLRSGLRELVGAEQDTPVVFLQNVSAAATGVAYSLDWKAGDRVLLGSSEFPANTTPWKLAAGTFGLEVQWFDEDLLRRDPLQGWSELERHLRENRPRLVALSAVSFWSGYRIDSNRLTALCHSYGAEVFLDAVQALGTVPLEMGSVDYLAGGSHKGMLSPEGAGFLLVSPKAALGWVPRLGSWLSLPDPIDFLTSGDPNLNPNDSSPRGQDPTVLEGGSANALGYAGLAASLAYLQTTGPQAIFEQIQRLQEPLDVAMRGLGFRSLRSDSVEGRSALLCYDPPEGCDVVKLVHFLGACGVQAGIPKGRLRFGLHLPTTENEVEKLIEVMQKAVTERVGAPDPVGNRRSNCGVEKEQDVPK